MTARAVTVITAGPLSTIQDQGRPGFGHLGIGRSGAADLRSLRRANLLVGNAPGAAGIEMTFGGLRLRFDDGATIALSGAPFEVSIGGRPATFDTVLAVRPGEELRCRAPRRGVRSYLAVGGGIAVPAVLGSRSTDTLSGLGPAPLQAGVSLPLGPPTTPCSAPPAGPEFAVRQALEVVPGPRAGWFTRQAADLLVTAEWSVTPQADRVGIRLTGPRLTRRLPGELPSEPMVAGALQVPPDGRPILFLADHPVTGGYPVIAVVAERQLGDAAQLRPGDTLRFEPAHQVPRH